MPRPPDAPPSNPVAQEASMRRSPLAAVCLLLLLWTVAGCTDLFGTRGPVNRLSVRVDSALVGQFGDAVGTRAYMTIRNEGKETVLLEFPCSAVLSRSTSQGWEHAWAPLCLAMMLNPTALAPGESMRAHIEPRIPIFRDSSSWRAGLPLPGPFRVQVTGIPERGEVFYAHSGPFRFVPTLDAR